MGVALKVCPVSVECAPWGYPGAGEAEMDAFQWNQHFETGLADVDRQHKALVDLINRFGELVGDGHGVEKEQLVSVFRELAAYAQYHFKEERNLSVSAGVEPEVQRAHDREHDAFLRDVVHMRHLDNPATANQLLRFLVHWLAWHILGTDQGLARQILAIQGGASPADALAAERRLQSATREPLREAVEGMFHLVTERNAELRTLNQTLEARVEERTAALSKANLDLVATVKHLEEEREESRRLSRELARANEQLEELALTDPLTGLPNRRHALRQLHRLWEESAANGRGLACMMIDADGFKPINDTFGHDAGDKVLRGLARELRHSVRTDDIVCRLGGDEFLVICPATSLDGAAHAAELTRQAVAALRLAAGSGTWNGSISVGVAARELHMGAPEDLLKAADEAVYAAKRGGRNRVCRPGDAVPLAVSAVG